MRIFPSRIGGQFRGGFFPSLRLVPKLAQQKVGSLRAAGRRRIRRRNSLALRFVRSRSKYNRRDNQQKQNRSGDEQEFAVARI